MDSAKQDFSTRLELLFSRWLRQDCTPEEVGELVRLLAQADAEATLSEPMRALWAEWGGRTDVFPVDWEGMYSRVSRVEEEFARMKRRRMVGWWQGIAAGLLVVVAAAAYWSMRGSHPAGMAEKPGLPMVKSEALKPAPLIRVEAAEGKKVVHLADGSMIILNKHSWLAYAAESAQEVSLSGEAYFDIVHRPDRAFLVHTGKLTTRVLGTAFDIKAYPAGAAIEVTVDRGKVQVLNEGTNIGLLSDNMQIRWDRGSEGYSRQRVDVKPVIAWKPEETSFDDITMAEAARRIEGQFHVSVRFVQPSLGRCRVTATFYPEDDLKEVMTVICAVSQANFSIDGNKIVIDGKGCK
jgi:transmembrane sensor